MEEADGMKQATVTEGNGGQASQLTKVPVTRQKDQKQKRKRAPKGKEWQGGMNCKGRAQSQDKLARQGWK